MEKQYDDKRKIRLILCFLLSVTLLSTCLSFNIQAATFEEVNASNVFLKQEGNSTCTLSATAMMLRRTSMLRGDTNWYNITESAIKSTAWSSSGLKWNFTYNGISVAHSSISGTEASKKQQLISLLSAHPEGIVLYYHSSSKQHAVLLTDYTNGIFYCADPYGGKPSGRIPLSQCLYVTVANANYYWYVTSPDVSFSPSFPPANATISKSNIWYDLGDTIELTMHADYATGYFLSMFKDGKQIVGERVDSGLFSMSASKYGIGHYTAYCAGLNSLGSIDSSWIDFDVVGAPGYSSISVTKKYYNISDTVSISIEPVCSKGQVIGIDKNGIQRVVTQDCGTTYTTAASFLGVGKYSAYFSIYNGSGTYDTERVEFEIVDMLSDLAITDFGNEFYAYIEHQSGTYLTPQNHNIIGGTETGEENQIWKLTRLQNGAYKVQNVENGGYMTIEDGRDEDAVNITMSSDYTGEPNQQFYFYNQCGGIYIRPLSSEKRVLNMNSDANLELWYFGTDWAPQKFNIIKIDTQYTISYDANGGTGAPETQKKTAGVSLTLSSEKPKKSFVLSYNDGILSSKTQEIDAVFVEWNTDQSGTGVSYRPGMKYSMDKDLKLYAVWENPKIGTLETPIRSGYVFEGWYTSVKGGTKITADTVLTKNLTVYAHWKKSVLPGDVNDDKAVNTKDSVLLRNYILDGTSINVEAADVNDDGKITTADSVLLRKYILGEDVELK